MLDAGVARREGVDEGVALDLADVSALREPARMLRERVVLPLPVPQPSVTEEAAHVVVLTCE